MKDQVNHPKHYKTDTIECIDAMESFLGEDGFKAHCKACAFKYIWRSGKKNDEQEDLKKAVWYLNRIIK